MGLWDAVFVYSIYVGVAARQRCTPIDHTYARILLKNTRIYIYYTYTNINIFFAVCLVTYTPHLCENFTATVDCSVAWPVICLFPLFTGTYLHMHVEKYLKFNLLTARHNFIALLLQFYSQEFNNKFTGPAGRVGHRPTCSPLCMRYITTYCSFRSVPL